METPDAILDKGFVKKLLRHGSPIVMVDKMYAFTDTSIRSGLRILSDNIFLQDGRFSEGGLIEHMAQTVALHTGYQFFLRNEEAPVGYIGSIRDIDIKRLPLLNDEIITDVMIRQEFAGVTLVDISTKLNDVEIASGQMKTVLAK